MPLVSAQYSIVAVVGGNVVAVVVEDGVLPGVVVVTSTHAIIPTVT